MLVPPLVPSGVSPLAPACLMFAAVCLDASPPSSHRFISSFMLGYVPFPSACLGSFLFPLHPVIDICSGSAVVSWLLASRPVPRQAGRGDTTALRRFSVLLACSLRLAIPSVRFGIGWRRGWRLRPMSIISAVCYLSDFLVVLPSCRPIISSSSLPDHSTRGTGRGFLAIGCLPLLFDFACGLFARVLCIETAGVVLLA